jgi:endoglucanase
MPQLRPRKIIAILMSLVLSACLDVLPLPSKAQAPFARQLYSYTAEAGTLYANGQEIQLHGVNWFGFDTQTHVVQGLWTRSLGSMIDQMQSLGINSVRLPICPATLQGVPISSVDYYANPELQGLNSRQALNLLVRDFNIAHIYVVIDQHSIDCGGGSPLWYTATYTQADWLADLSNIASSYAALPYFLGVDLDNEPYGATWGTGNPATDWKLAAAAGGDAVLTADPRALVFVQGVFTNPTCTSPIDGNWGEDVAPAACYPLALPSGKYVLSPHVFGSDLALLDYYATANFPANLPAAWNAEFSSVLAAGDTLVIGEWGGKMGTDGGTSQDLTIQEALTTWLAQHTVCNSFYWSWGPNSNDTGGLLESDWQTAWPVKQAVLQHYYAACSSH